jgi:hypothetical protein
MGRNKLFEIARGPLAHATIERGVFGKWTINGHLGHLNL